MFAAVAIPIQSGRLADVGSGGGFPGIPLKIYRPELEVFLVESNAKKATFLAEVTRGLGLTNTRVLVSRYEELGEEVAPLDYICARALGDFDKLLEWSIRRETAAKEVVLWLGAEDANKVRTNASWDWRPPISIPHSLRRLLLVGAPKADVAVGVTTTK
jgi:16S rRNA (guanine527-N7)-methyltransferase